MDAHQLGWHVAMATSSGAVAAPSARCGRWSATALRRWERERKRSLRENLSQQRLCGAMCDRVEATDFA
jgi:hypothetical protein